MTEKQKVQTILIIGNGGREAAIADQYYHNPDHFEVHASPGSDWMLEYCGVTCHDVKANDIEGLLALAQEIKPDLTIVGPEDPLVDGIADLFRANGLTILGPTQKAARHTEGSKVLCTKMLQRAGVRIPRSWIFDNPEAAHAFVDNHDGELVVKADGPALGKGVIVTSTNERAHAAIDKIMVERAFGDAGDQIVIQERLRGRECSVMVLVDGKGNIVPLPPSRDCKPAYPGGPNTGGMGAYSPVSDFTHEMWDTAIREIIVPTLQLMEREGRPFTGVLYAGLMEVSGRLYLIEYNCRFGDPEIQAILARLLSPLHDLLMAAATNSLINYVDDVRWSDEAAICVVVASQGYPGECDTGHVIHNLDVAEDHANVLHAGTKMDEQDNWINTGGRVINCVATHYYLAKAHQLATQAADSIKWSGRWFRDDIGVQS